MKMIVFQSLIIAVVFTQTTSIALATNFLWDPSSGFHILQLPEGASYSCAEALNNNGQVVGHFSFAGRSYQGFSWQPGAQATLLDISFAQHINDSGQIAGINRDQNGTETAVMWDEVSGYKRISPLTENGNIYLSDMNNTGQVVGCSDNHAVLWNEQNGTQDLGVLDGGLQSLAQGINNLGQIVGVSTTSHWVTRNGVLWDSALDMQDLGLLATPDANSSPNHSGFTAINDAGIATGNMKTISNTDATAMIWDSINGYNPIGDGILNSNRNYAIDINNQGQVIINNSTTNSKAEAYTWDLENGLTRFSIPDSWNIPGIWNFVSLIDINDAGQILGHASFTTVPVPASLWLFISGLAICLRPRKQKP